MAGVGFSGKDGDVKIGSTAICEIKGWSFNPKATNPRYASNKTAGYKRTVAGVKEGSGTMSGVYDLTTPHHGVIDIGTDVTLKLYLNAAYFYSVPAVIDDYKINVDLDTGEFVSWEATFSTNGAWTNPVAPMMAPQDLPLTKGNVENITPFDVAKVGIVGTYNADILRQDGLLNGSQPNDIKAAARAAALEALKELIDLGILRTGDPRPEKATPEAKVTDNGIKTGAEAAAPVLAPGEGLFALDGK
jgi:hypothetical protein